MRLNQYEQQDTNAEWAHTAMKIRFAGRSRDAHVPLSKVPWILVLRSAMRDGIPSADNRRSRGPPGIRTPTASAWWKAPSTTSRSDSVRATVESARPESKSNIGYNVTHILGVGGGDGQRGGNDASGVPVVNEMTEPEVSAPSTSIDFMRKKQVNSLVVGKSSRSKGVPPRVIGWRLGTALICTVMGHSREYHQHLAPQIPRRL